MGVSWGPFSVRYTVWNARSSTASHSVGWSVLVAAAVRRVNFRNPPCSRAGLLRMVMDVESPHPCYRHVWIYYPAVDGDKGSRSSQGPNRPRPTRALIPHARIAAKPSIRSQPTHGPQPTETEGVAPRCTAIFESLGEARPNDVSLNSVLDDKRSVRRPPLTQRGSNGAPSTSGPALQKTPHRIRFANHAKPDGADRFHTANGHTDTGGPSVSGRVRLRHTRDRCLTSRNPY